MLNNQRNLLLLLWAADSNLHEPLELLPAACRATRCQTHKS